jgi:hypothetical protein
MLHRQHEEGIIVISQPAHAWVSGQLARAWGNHKFSKLSEEVCFAAEQHDLGFLDWERAPTLNEATGLPHQFMEMPISMHLEIWTKGILQMMRYGRYPALLVSRHFTFIANKNDVNRSPSERQSIGHFLEAQETLQTTLATSLCNDFYYSARCNEDRFDADQELVSLLDWISLQILLDCREQKLNKPMTTRLGTFEVIPGKGQGAPISLKPWPFADQSVTVLCEGRHLLTRFKDQQSMQESLKAAAPVSLLIVLKSE